MPSHQLAPSLIPQNRAQLRNTLAAVVACNAVGGLSGLATTGAIREWLPTLNQPKYQPPNWLFAPVWTALYTTMGVSISAVHRQPEGPARTKAERLSAVQLAVNALWSYLFFVRRSPLAALIDSALIVVSVGATVRAIWAVDRRAAILLLPYLIWLSFAFVLNADLVRLNRR